MNTDSRNVGISYLWLGTYVPNDYLAKLQENNIRPSSGTLAEGHIISGLEEVCDEKFDIISSIRIAHYPKSKQINIRSYRSEASKVSHIGYINLPILNLLIREFRLTREVRRWIKKHQRDENSYIFVYSMHSAFLKAAAIIKKENRNAKIIVFVPDLPLFMSTDPSIKRLFKHIDWIRIRSLMKHIDFYALYTEHMVAYLGLQDNNWMTFEGAYNFLDLEESSYDRNEKKENNPRVWLYVGNLSFYNNISGLIDAFNLIQLDDIELHFVGSGEAIKIIEKASKTNERIKYLGVASQQKAFEYMQNADLLLNPRPSTEEYTLYSFPSKIIEYMASGTPVVSTRLPGIPEEYFQHMFVFEDESTVGMFEKLNQILEMKESERFALGKSAKNFVVMEKNSVRQAERLVERLESLGISH